MELPANMITPTVRSRDIYCIYRPLMFLAEQAFCERVKSQFEGVPNVQIYVRDEGTFPHVLCLLTQLTQLHQLGPRRRAWYASLSYSWGFRLTPTQRTFLSVTHGTSEPAKFLEMWDSQRYLWFRSRLIYSQSLQRRGRGCAAPCLRRQRHHLRFRRN